MDRIKNRFTRFVRNNSSEGELEQLYRDFEAMDQDVMEALIDEELERSVSQSDGLPPPAYLQRNKKKIKIYISRTAAKQTNPRFALMKRWISIAAFLAIGLCFYIYKYKGTVLHDNQIVISTEDIDPGSNTATLRLSNGQSFQLNDKNGELISNDSGEILYQDGTALVQMENVDDILVETPRAGQYQVVLPDGTKVWLNAETKIEYPSRFASHERRVKLIGEAYFEVVSAKDKPFVITTDQQDVIVFGTSLNVHAYPMDKNTTTLVEGEVQVRAHQNDAKTSLKPNEQTVLLEGKLEKRIVDPVHFTGWKDGFFRFHATDLDEVLKQLERWYDLDVDYTQVPKNIRVYATVRRDNKLSSILYAIEQVTMVEFKLSGRRLEVM